MKRIDISIQIYENLYETDNSLEKCRLPKLTPLQLESWDRPIIIEKIKLLKSNPIKKSTGEFYQTLKDQIVPRLYKLCQCI